MVSFSNVPVAQALSGLLSSPANTVGTGATRSAWTFTSQLRMLSQTARTVDSFAGFDGGALSDRVVAEALSYTGPGVMPVITLAVNPHTVSFDRPKRITQRKVRNGTVLFHWTDHKGRNSDILTLKMQASTGNIDMRGALSGQPDNGAAYKLQVWHNLLLLTQEPAIIGDRLLNEVILTYTSPLMRIPIEFRGQFAREMTYSETAAKPHSRDYELEFLVTATEPEPQVLVQEILAVLQAVQLSAGNTSSKIVGP